MAIQYVMRFAFEADDFPGSYIFQFATGAHHIFRSTVRYHNRLAAKLCIILLKRLRQRSLLDVARRNRSRRTETIHGVSKMWYAPG